MSYKHLAAELIGQAVSDFRKIKARGFITPDGRPNFGRLIINRACMISQRHREKDRKYALKKIRDAGLLSRADSPPSILRECEQARTRKSTIRPLLDELSLEDADSAVWFLHSAQFDDLCGFVGLDAEAVRRHLFSGKA